MKKHFFTLGLCLAFAGYVYAEDNSPAAQTERTEINQYGQQVTTAPLEATVRNGVTWFENKEKGYRFWFDNRVQVDFANYHNQRNGTITGPDGSNGNFNDPNSTPHMPGGISLRRIRFAMKAEISDQWYGELDFNMANGNFGVQDAFIQFDGLSRFGLQFKLGNFKEDFSMEYTTSSRYVTFMERPMCVTAFNFTRRLGFQAQWLHPQSWLRVSAGVTGQEIDGWTLRMNVEENMKREIRGSGPNFTGKIVLMPWGSEPDQGLHFGYNIQHRSGRWISDDLDERFGRHDTRSWYAMRVDSRNSTHVNRTKYLDTRWFNGVRRSLYQGFELAGYKNGFRFGSEFIMQDAIMDRTLFNFPTFSGSNAQELADIYAKNKRFWGFYIQTGYLLFGGKQRYDVSQSEFTQPTRGRSWGDLEVLFRYDYLDLNNNHNDRLVHEVLPNDIVGQPGGSAHNFTFGLSYWINPSMRFTMNYMISQTDVFANGGGGRNPAGRRYTAVGRNAAGHYTANPFDVVSDPGIRFNTLQMRLEIWF